MGIVRSMFGVYYITALPLLTAILMLIKLGMFALLFLSVEMISFMIRAIERTVSFHKFYWW